MSCSSSTKRSPSGSDDEPWEQRRHLHPGEPLVAARRVAHGDGQVEREVRDVGERVGGVDRERGEHREDRLGEERRRGARARRRPARPSRRTGSRRPRARARPRCANTAAARPTSSSTRSRMARSCSTRSSPSGVVLRRPAASCSMRPETRTSKNSSRFWLKMARNLARSSSGQVRVLGQGEHAVVEVEPRELAVEEPIGRILQRRSRLRECDVQPGHRTMVLPVRDLPTGPIGVRSEG